MDFSHMTKIVDDSLLWDNSIEDTFWHTLEYIELCGKNGIVFNPKKFKFAMDKINFAGFNITPTGLCPSECLMDAIIHFAIPTNITDVRSWFGLINQAAYSFSLTDEMLPF